MNLPLSINLLTTRKSKIYNYYIKSLTENSLPQIDLDQIYHAIKQSQKYISGPFYVKFRIIKPMYILLHLPMQ